MVQLLGGEGANDRVILVLRECIWNTPAVSIVLSASLGSPPRGGLSPWVNATRFLAGNREAELKPTTFSSLLLLHFFLSSSPNPPAI